MARLCAAVYDGITTALAVALAASVVAVLVSYDSTSTRTAATAWAGVIVNAVLSAWLLSWRSRSAARWAAVVVLACYFTVSVGRFVAGAKECGCFGRVVVPPGVTAAFDAVVLAVLLSLKPAEAGRAESRPSSGWGGVIALATRSVPTAAVVAAAVLYAMPPRPGVGTVVWDGRRLAGRPLPLLQYIADDDVRRALSVGSARVLVVSTGCATCRDYLAATGPNLKPRTKGGSVYVVNLAADDLPAGPAGMIAVKLRGGASYLCEVPLLLDVDDGIVTTVDLPDRNQRG